MYLVNSESSSIASINILSEKNNKFQSFDEFKKFIRHSFIEGSVINEQLFDTCIIFHCDQEYTHGNDVNMPIHDALGWEFKRFRQQANEPIYAAFLMNEDGTIWQAIVSLWDEERQRPYKYLAPKGIGDKVFLPPVPTEIRAKIANKYGLEIPLDGSFWKWVEDVDIPRIITEGGKKSLCALSHGYVSLGLYGCTCGAKNKDETGNEVKPYLIEDLDKFASPDSKWLTAFDRDEKQTAKLSVAAGKKRIRLALQSRGCFCSDISWKSQEGKGMDDFIFNQGSGAFDGSYQKAVDNLERLFNKESLVNDLKGSKRKRWAKLISNRWHDLRFNEMTLKVELNGEPLDFDTLSIRIAEEFDIDLGQDTSCQIVLYLAKKRSYSPVREYLEKVFQEYENKELSILDNLASRYFGTKDPLYDVFMKRHLIGQVKRVFQPGCQHDTVLVLQGAMGLQKSKFWRTLAIKPDWFDDSLGNGSSDKDDRMKLRRFFMLELAEIESIFKKKEIAAFRGFITTKSDGLRVPYGRAIESFPRTSCFVGTVNPDQFLVDPEGHRRFWIIPVQVDFIDVDQLEKERDQIWAAAVAAYQTGERNYLTREEEKRNATLNKRYVVDDCWQDVICDYLTSIDECTVGEILTKCLQIELSRQDKATQMRVAECLKRIGWVKSERQKKIEGKVTYVWRRPETSSDEVLSTKCSNENTTVHRSEISEENLEKRCQPEEVKIAETVVNKGLDTVDTFEQTFESGQLVKVVAGKYKGKILEVVSVDNEFLKCRNGEESVKIENKDVISLPAKLPEPELFLLGEGGRRNRKVNLQPLVGKKVRVTALGGEEYLVVAIDWKGNLVAQSLSNNRKAILTLKDID